MKNFLSVEDVNDLPGLLKSAEEIKKNPLKEKGLGSGKCLGLIFLNPSLRTRLSTQRAAYNLGMQTMVMNLMEEGWKMETHDGAVMDGENVEHIREAAAVIGRYCEIIGIRTFPQLKDRNEDYQEMILRQMIKFSGRPVISLESATRHPLQSFADMMTIEEYISRNKRRPRVVMSWAPHPKALPQSVPNSFAEWSLKMNYELVITHPEGYELDPGFVKNATIEHDQDKALEGADIVYMKNWSSYHEYGKILCRDRNWTLTLKKLEKTNQAKVMHCLPVRRNVVIADDVLDSEHSIVIQEAENRVYTAQAVIRQLLKDNVL